ncbi:MAG: hypothetical protein LQ342_001706 [Letrouitia transgressa]|nr:MAG: hypothetical protein LQ342_001706 [Letrouitia transgressa]
MADLHDNPPFSSAAQDHFFVGILFDMDGTIIDSTAAVVKHWQKIGEELGFDPEIVLQTAHGRRSIDTIALYDPSKANWEYVSHIEGLIPRQYGADAVEIPGARRLLGSLEGAKVPWAIVTSGTRPLVTGWLEVMKLSHPRNLVVAEDVTTGKPAPECYLLGKARLGLSAERAPGEVLVIEDAPAGVQAGKAAGCKVLAVATSHKIEQLKGAGADWIVQDLRSVMFMGLDETSGQVHIKIRNAVEE